MRAEAQADGTPESASSTENEELIKPFSWEGAVKLRKRVRK